MPLRAANETFILLLFLLTQSGCSTPSRPTCPILAEPGTPVQAELLQSPKTSGNSTAYSAKVSDFLKQARAKSTGSKAKTAALPLRSPGGNSVTSVSTP